MVRVEATGSPVAASVTTAATVTAAGVRTGPAVAGRAGWVTWHPTRVIARVAPKSSEALATRFKIKSFLRGVVLARSYMLWVAMG